MILGIDTASVGGAKKIDWQRARAAGCTFAFLRATYGEKPDTLFQREWQKVAEAGIVRGAYMFWRAAKDVDAQVDAFTKIVKLSSRDFPPVIDVEFPGGGISNTGLTPSAAIDRLYHVRSGLRARYGFEPILYTSARVFKEDLKNLSVPALIDCPLWLARYPYKPGPWKQPPPVDQSPPVPVGVPWGGEADNYFFWQYQGDAIGFPGFSGGNVDMNRFNPMIRGAKGKRVKWVQRRLELSVEDGIFGTKTEDALRLFQRNQGLVLDGIVGPRTFARLCQVPA